MDLGDVIAALIQIAMGVTLVWVSVARIKTSKSSLTKFWKVGLAITFSLGSCILISTLTGIFLMASKAFQD